MSLFNKLRLTWGRPIIGNHVTIADLPLPDEPFILSYRKMFGHHTVVI